MHQIRFTVSHAEPKSGDPVHAASRSRTACNSFAILLLSERVATSAVQRLLPHALICRMAIDQQCQEPLDTYIPLASTTTCVIVRIVWKAFRRRQ